MIGFAEKDIKQFAESLDQFEQVSLAGFLLGHNSLLLLQCLVLLVCCCLTVLSLSVRAGRRQSSRLVISR